MANVMPPVALAAALQPASTLERRLAAEWKILCALIELNPDRLGDPAAVDTRFHVTLDSTPSLPLPPQTKFVTSHELRVEYPRYFPAVPLELYLERPVRHPNVHPMTGFVCLWETHRIDHTIEHALHKTAAILGWKLQNLDVRHVMQPEAAGVSPAERQTLVQRLEAPALRGILHPAASVPGSLAEYAKSAPRRRLS